MSDVRNDAVWDALRKVQDPDLKRDLVTLGMIEDLAVAGGRVSFTLVLTTAACPLKDEIEAECRAAVQRSARGPARSTIRTTSRVRKPKDPTADRKALRRSRARDRDRQRQGWGRQVHGLGESRSVAGRDAEPASACSTATSTAPTCRACSACGASRSQREGKIMPVEAWGLRFMSMGLLVDQGEAVVWRGPMLHGAIKSFLHDVDWGELDYLLVDLPPGTGDVQLSLIQQTYVGGRGGGDHAVDGRDRGRGQGGLDVRQARGAGARA